VHAAETLAVEAIKPLADKTISSDRVRGAKPIHKQRNKTNACT
jgi:hypothetical protein